MASPPVPRRWRDLVLVIASGLVGTGCGGSPPSSGQPPGAVPGAITVRGTERLAWGQEGYVASLRFIAYVDGNPVSLDQASCSRGADQAECFAPLPPLTTGVHTLAVAALSGSVEGERSAAVTVLKVSGTAGMSAASLPDSRPPGEPRLETIVDGPGGMMFAADVVARDVVAPAQMAWSVDGRLFLAQADGRVLVLRPDVSSEPAMALDTNILMNPAPLGPLALALHPDFVSNHFVYVSFFAEDSPGQPVLRVVRLREVGDTLGEPVSVFQAPVVLTLSTARIGDGRDGANDVTYVQRSTGPRLAFGPDRLMYLSLPPGLEFESEPAASTPLASMLRLDDRGRAAEAGPLSGVVAAPLGFAWHPASRALSMIFPNSAGGAQVQSVTNGAAASGGLDGLRLRVAEEGSPAAGALVIDASDARTLEWIREASANVNYASIGLLRLAVPIVVQGVLGGVSDPIGDVVAAEDGTLFLATSFALQSRGDTVAAGDVILRLQPRSR